MQVRPTTQKLITRFATNLAAIAAVCTIFGLKALENEQTNTIELVAAAGGTDMVIAD